MLIQWSDLTVEHATVQYHSRQQHSALLLIVTWLNIVLDRQHPPQSPAYSTW